MAPVRAIPDRIDIHYDGNLLTITLIVKYHGQALQITDVIVDTGSSHTIFSPDVLEQIGVTYENGDPVYEAYGIGGTFPFYTAAVAASLFIMVSQFSRY